MRRRPGGTAPSLWAASSSTCRSWTGRGGYWRRSRRSASARGASRLAAGGWTWLAPAPPHHQAWLALSVAEPRIEQIADAVAEERKAQDGERDHGTRRHR